MISDEFRLLALGLANARFAHQLGNLNFLIGEKVFASLGAPNPAYAILKLAPDDQARAMARAPGVFTPQAGGAGVRGVTCVRLAAATAELVLPALKAAVARAADGSSPRMTRAARTQRSAS